MQKQHQEHKMIHSNDSFLNQVTLVKRNLIIPLKKDTNSTEEKNYKKKQICCDFWILPAYSIK